MPVFQLRTHGHPRQIEFQPTEVDQKEKFRETDSGTFRYLLSKLVNLTTKQIETLFGELEYTEPRLEALGV